MKKFSKIKRLGHDRNQGILEEGKLIIKEKLDGANFRATVTEVEGQHKWLFGSKNVEYKINGEPDYEENVDSRFTAAIKHIRENVDPERVAETFGTHYTFFGENMVSHSLEYDWEEIPQFIGFDIYDEEKEKWLEWNEAYSFFESLGLETAPIVARMPAEDFDDDFEVPESKWRDGKAEGVVIINTGQEEDGRSGFSTRAKTVTEEFEEKHQQSMGSSSKEAIHGHEKIVAGYCTNARIKKTVHKMRDEGRNLGMEMMENKGDSKGLPMRVTEDIFEEEYEEIVRSNHEVDFKELRSAVAKRCVSVLKSVIQNEAIKG